MFSKDKKGIVYQVSGEERGKLTALLQLTQGLQRDYVAALNLIVAREGIVSDAAKQIAFNQDLMAFVLVPAAAGGGNGGQKAPAG